MILKLIGIITLLLLAAGFRDYWRCKWYQASQSSEIEAEKRNLTRGIL